MIAVVVKLARKLFIEPWKAIDEESLELRSRKPEAEPALRSRRYKKRDKAQKKVERVEMTSPPRSFDYRPLVVLVVVAVSLTLQEYLGQQDTYQKLYPVAEGGHYYQLGGFAWWSGWRVFGYVIIPILAIWAMPGERVRDYFISFRGFLSHIWIYVGLFALILPVVIYASTTDSFRATYPFYKLARRSSFDLWAWEAMYAVQFVALEFFFRGFMLKALAPRFGSGAIFVMIVPYCMIHYGKPLPETLGAIGAGLILGTLAMRTKSIWGGVAIHIAVAISMDVLALRN